jgi:membrane associated rhomboid family serine protease
MGIYDRPYYRDSSSPDLGPSWDQRSAVSTIIIICVVVFVANLIFGGRARLIQDFLSLHSEDASRPWMLWRALTYGFVHSGKDIFHIIFNMFELWLLGRAVEERYGRTEFLRLYLVCVVACGLGWLFLRNTMGDNAILCGASGAVCCSTMLYVLNYPKATLLLFGVLPIQAWMLGAFMIFTNLTSQSAAGITSLGDGRKPAIAFDVHLIGIAFAFAYFYGHWQFSRLTSPMDWLRSIRRRWFGPKLKAYRPDVETSNSAEIEADRILDKIHRLGQDALTSKEKRFLENYSKQVRDKRRGSES